MIEFHFNGLNIGGYITSRNIAFCILGPFISSDCDFYGFNSVRHLKKFSLSLQMVNAELIVEVL